MTSSLDDSIDLLGMAEEVSKGELGSSQDVATNAKTVNQRAIRAHKSTQDILNHLRDPKIREEVLDIEYPPGFDEILTDPTFQEVVMEIMELTEKYKHGNFDPSDMNKDIMHLAALQMQLGPRVGYAEAQMKHAESTMKLVTARYMIKAKDYQSANSMTISVDLMRSVAAEAAEDVRVYWGQYLALATTYKSLYFATKQFIEVMNFAAGRMFGERRLPQEG